MLGKFEFVKGTPFNFQENLRLESPMQIDLRPRVLKEEFVILVDS